MILVVDDTYKFHQANMSVPQNYRLHYSYASKRLPLAFTDAWVQNGGARLYFNPLIPMASMAGIDPADKRRLKYGVISEEMALKDLRTWDTFAFAGRTQKVILPLVDNSKEVRAALSQNL